MENKYLAHHGIKGQKWGVRRYQNEDGSLTSEGQRKYNSLESNNNRLTKKISRYDVKSDRYALKAERLKSKSNKLDSKIKKETKNLAEDGYRSKDKLKKLVKQRSIYSKKVLSYSTKSAKFKLKSSKAAYKLEKNKRYQLALTKKLSDISEFEYE